MPWPWQSSRRENTNRKFALSQKATYSCIDEHGRQLSWRPCRRLEALRPGARRLSSSKGHTRRKTATQSDGPFPQHRTSVQCGGWLPRCRRDRTGEEPVRPRMPPSAASVRARTIRDRCKVVYVSKADVPTRTSALRFLWGELLYLAPLASHFFSSKYVKAKKSKFPLQFACFCLPTNVEKWIVWEGS